MRFEALSARELGSLESPDSGGRVRSGEPRGARSLPGIVFSLDQSPIAVQAAAALVRSGLTQMNVRIPDNATVGVRHFFYVYSNRATQNALVGLLEFPPGGRSLSHSDCPHAVPCSY